MKRNHPKQNLAKIVLILFLNGIFLWPVGHGGAKVTDQLEAGPLLARSEGCPSLEAGARAASLCVAPITPEGRRRGHG